MCVWKGGGGGRLVRSLTSVVVNKVGMGDVMLIYLHTLQVRKTLFGNKIFIFSNRKVMLYLFPAL